MEPVLERKLAESLSQSTFGSVLAMEPNEQRRLIQDLQMQSDTAIGQGYQPVLLCSNQLRLPMRRLMEKYLPSLHVLAYNEVAAKADVEFVGQVRMAA
jgi:flagellar biosynthesis protein FlhA